MGRRGFKADLHLHLDGSLPLCTIYELIELNGMEEIFEKIPDVESLIMAPDSCQSLNEYLKCFELPGQLLQTPEAMIVAGYGLANELRRTGVRYAEIRFAPQLHSVNVPMNEKYEHEKRIIEGLLLGIKKATRFSGTKINLILCMMRNLPDGELGALANSRTIALAKEFFGKGVVALDLAGAEARDATVEFEEQFMLARSLRIPFTIHAGEAGSDDWRLDSIERAIYYGAKRIGHGVGLVNSKELRQLVRDTDIVIECCPISNFQTKAVVGGIENHPIRLFLEEGLKVTVNTDNMTVSNTSLDKEYELLRMMGITENDIFNMQLNAISGAFASEKEKVQMLKRA